MSRYFRASRRWGSSTLCLLPLLLAQMAAAPLRADTARAGAAIQAGRADEAASLLHNTLQTDPQNAKAHQLLCRVYYAQDLFDDAVRECEAAVAIAPNDSDNQLWLGRAYGQQASRANLISAFSLARRVHAAFEESVRLDPNNTEAFLDLGTFYVLAPGAVGGGVDKAQALIPRMQELSVVDGHKLLAMIANKKGDTSTAEAEYKKAIDAGGTPDTYIDLGHFYQQHQRFDEAESVLQQGIHQDQAHDDALVDAASILTAAHRDTQLAEQLLREYLASPAKSENAPAFRVHVQLGKLLASDGDKAGARREYDAALALASQYPEAKKALEKL
ncbi:MAG TPA: tetratricopeptide repeat protein [Granulicella sp.]|nr:tetratricopeptide repeat protein [Granulicella sp.]